jgi:hypothetical protein
MALASERGMNAGAASRLRAAARLGLGLLAALPATTARADWDIGASAGALYDDNLTRAQNRADRRAASAISATASATNFVPFSGSDGVDLAAYARGELFDLYHGLSNVTIGATAAYRHKFGVGSEAPWAAVSVHAFYDAYRDDLRTGTQVEARTEVGQRFSAQADASASVYYQRYYDNHGEPIVPGISGKVFDLAGQGLDIRAGYALTDEWYFDARAGVRRGDVESTSQRSPQIFRASTAITNDPVWGDPSLFAYRVRGTTYTGTLTASYGLSDRASIDFAYRYAFTRASQGLEYATNTVYLTFTYRR